MSTEVENTGPVTIENPDLLLATFGQMNKDREFTTNALIDSYKSSHEEAQATLDAIRWGVKDLISGDFMPTPSALFRALYPTDEMIAEFMPKVHEN